MNLLKKNYVVLLKVIRINIFRFGSLFNNIKLVIKKLR